MNRCDDGIESLFATDSCKYEQTLDQLNALAQERTPCASKDALRLSARITQTGATEHARAQSIYKQCELRKFFTKAVIIQWRQATIAII